MRTLAEDLLLIALDDAKGTTSWQQSGILPYALAAALLADLALAGKVTLRDDKMVVVEPAPLDDELLDEALTRMKASKKEHDANYWVPALSGKVKKLQQRLENRLVAEGILRREQHKVLWVIESDRYPTLNPAPERTLREQLRAALLTDTAPDARTAILISLIENCKLIDRLVEKGERTAARARAKRLLREAPLAKTVGTAAKAAAEAAT